MNTEAIASRIFKRGSATAQSGCLYRLWKEQGVSTQGNPDLKFPAEFNQDVETSLNKLKTQYYETLLRYEQGKKASA